MPGYRVSLFFTPPTTSVPARMPLVKSKVFIVIINFSF
jgi:hypothetical protein